jgi:DNA invertase Pin-like site-specific DNA recombinase
MSDNLIQESHLRRAAYVYIRQSSATQVLVNRESTDRQYHLSERAVQLGWSKAQIKLVDEDLAQSGSGVVLRNGFAQMTNEVALGKVGIIICLEASRVARNNTEWYRLLDLCSVTDTLIGDLDGIYHPGLFNHRLLLGLKGTMAEAELHVLRMRLNGAIRNKAKRGELRRSLPVGLVWGEGEGQVIFHPDQAVVGAIRSLRNWARLAKCGFGFKPKNCSFRTSVPMEKFFGSSPPTLPFTRFWATRSMQVSMPMVKVALNATSMKPDASATAPAACRWSSGRY